MRHIQRNYDPGTFGAEMHLSYEYDLAPFATRPEEPGAENAGRAPAPTSPADPGATPERGMDRDPIGQPLPAEFPDGRR
jgi:hypothetical protein